MDKEIKKKILKNWFKILQEVICNDIEKLENNSAKFISENTGIKMNLKMKVVVNIEYLTQMVKFLKKLE